MESKTESTIKVMVMSCRKPGTTFAQYRSHYENKHVPLIVRLLLQDDPRPVSYTRQYIERDITDGSAPSFPFGGAESFGFDCIATLVFQNAEHRDDILAGFAKHREEIRKDEDEFLDELTLRLVFVSESCSNVKV